MAKVRERKWKNKKGKNCSGWFVDYNDINGQRTRQGGFKTKAEGTIFLAKELSDISRGINTSQDKNITFDIAAEVYIKYNTEIYCKPSTIETYKRYLNVHLKPFFTGIRLINITPQKVQEFIKHQIENTNLSNNSINKNVVLLGSILQKQVDEGKLLANPVYKIKKLNIKEIEMKALNKEEVQKLLETCKNHNPNFYPMLLTAIMTGMRRGELLGLTWDKINWVKKEILVNKSLFKGQLLEPKTKTSNRRINMPEELVKVLREWKLKSINNEKDFIFPSATGNSLDPRNLVRRCFDPIVKRAGIDKLRWHDLRHTFASLLIAQNIPAKYIQAQMGHSSIKITMDRYGHLLPEVHEQGVKALDGLFESSSANGLKQYYA